ncbi:hypothetical protein T459_28207 [Capsicum annuum]|uniref:Uncharacterized protein n=1 Tax=Capsicum annuum TaxID=4072 RepID=A0A2G2YG74_CAPAN|nr:hypothetical protein T459_28207 [Capsicum annuum]
MSDIKKDPGLLEMKSHQDDSAVGSAIPSSDANGSPNIRDIFLQLPQSDLHNFCCLRSHEGPGIMKSEELSEFFTETETESVGVVKLVISHHEMSSQKGEILIFWLRFPTLVISHHGRDELSQNVVTGGGNLPRADDIGDKSSLSFPA